MELIKQNLDIKIIDTIFDPDIYGIEANPVIPPERILNVNINTSGKSPLYKVWIFLSGNDLSYVENTTYRLHSTFTDPVRRVERNLTNPDCRLMIWTWGIFEIKATILHRSGRTYNLAHYLNYGKLLEKYQQDSTIKLNYIEQRPRETKGATLNPLRRKK